MYTTWEWIEINPNKRTGVIYYQYGQVIEESHFQLIHIENSALIGKFQDQQEHEYQLIGLHKITEILPSGILFQYEPDIYMCENELDTIKASKYFIELKNRKLAKIVSQPYEKGVLTHG